MLEMNYTQELCNVSLLLYIKRIFKGRAVELNTKKVSSSTLFNNLYFSTN